MGLKGNSASSSSGNTYTSHNSYWVKGKNPSTLNVFVKFQYYLPVLKQFFLASLFTSWNSRAGMLFVLGPMEK